MLLIEACLNLSIIPNPLLPLSWGRNITSRVMNSFYILSKIHTLCIQNGVLISCVIGNGDILLNECKKIFHIINILFSTKYVMNAVGNKNGTKIVTS